MFTDQSYTLLSIDPGINSLGWAISQCYPNQLIIEKFGTLYPTVYPKGSKLKGDSKHYSDRIIGSRILRIWLKEIIATYQPDYICSEDAFYNPGRPSAFTSLLIAIYAMESKLYAMYTNGEINTPESAKIYKLAPTTIKMIMHHELTEIGGKAEKSDMTNALRLRVDKKQIKFAQYKKFPSIEDLTEHSVDAICIGYGFTQLWKPLLEAEILENRMTAFTKSVRKLLKKKRYKSPFLKLT